jgi:hypothetical protein
MPYLSGTTYTKHSSFVFSIVLQYVKAAVLLLSLLTFFFSFFLFSSCKDMSTVCSNARTNINYFYANNPMTPNVSILCISFLLFNNLLALLLQSCILYFQSIQNV